MSNSFIGSKIAIITKSQCRYTGTIIGIDTQASSIVLGNVKCYGTENRIGNFFNQSLIGTIVPLMQFANNDIEDLKIVEDQPATIEPSKLSSIHDDPAIVSAVMSSPTNTNEIQSSWPPTSQQQQQTRNQFFDHSSLNHSEQLCSSTNIQSTDVNDRFRLQRNLPNNHYHHQSQRHFQLPNNSQRHFGNRETFQDNGNEFDDDFDFETNNQKFTKITSEEQFNEQQQQQQQFNTEHEVIYDKQKSFFDNTTLNQPMNSHGSMYNRSTNVNPFVNQRRNYYRGTSNSNYSRQQYGNDNYHYQQNPHHYRQ